MEHCADFTDLELSDEDILDAMQHIPGYLDITTEDFRIIYHLAHGHAMRRMFACMAKKLSLPPDTAALNGEMSLDQAAKILVQSNCPGLPVAGADGQVIGVLLHKEFFPAIDSEPVP